MLSYFRVNELQTLLTAFRVHHTGRKNDLQTRALKLLDSNFTEVAHKIREIDRNINRTEKKQSLPLDVGAPVSKKAMYQPQVQVAVQSNVRPRMIGNTIITNNIIPFANNPAAAYPIHPDVRLKKLPFYDDIATLLCPSTLVPVTNQRLQETSFYFTLTPQQATEIAINRDIRNPAKIEFTIQVQLRFCLLETSCEQEDCFPPNILIKVNNKLCALPNLILTNRPNIEPKRPPKPVNVTANVKLSPTVTNSITVQWAHSYNRAYVITACLVRKLSSHQLLTRMKIKGSKSADFTRALIKEKLNEDADSEIATTMLKVSLICPLGKMRMKIPCRSSTCSHLQCFDASLFLQMNERKPTWHCPVCDKLTLYENLVIDGYFQEVLASPLLTSNINEIQLHKDGSWSVQTHSNDKSRSRSTEKIEIISDDLEVITDETKTITVMPSSSSSSSSSLSNNIEPTSSTNNDIIDLTFGDSNDDLPLATIKALPCSSNSQYNTGNLKIFKRKIGNTSSSSSSSTIVLDSPTPSPSSSSNNIIEIKDDEADAAVLTPLDSVSRKSLHNHSSDYQINPMSAFKRMRIHSLVEFMRSQRKLAMEIDINESSE